MAVSEIEQLLIDYLRISKAKRDVQVIAFIMTGDSEDQMLELCQYLSENEEATGEEILAAARRISGQ